MKITQKDLTIQSKIRECVLNNPTLPIVCLIDGNAVPNYSLFNVSKVTKVDVCEILEADTSFNGDKNYIYYDRSMLLSDLEAYLESKNGTVIYDDDSVKYEAEKLASKYSDKWIKCIGLFVE